MFILKSNLKKQNGKNTKKAVEKAEKKLHKKYAKIITKMNEDHKEKIKEKNKKMIWYEKRYKKYKHKSFAYDEIIRDIDGLADFLEHKIQEISVYCRNIAHTDIKNKMYFLKNEVKNEHTI